MAKDKQSKSVSDKEKKEAVLFKNNIKKHQKETKKTSKSIKKETKPQKISSYMIKIVLIGDAAVGKTSIRQRYLGKGFQKEHLTTLGAYFAAITKEVDDFQIKYQIWDLAG